MSNSTPYEVADHLRDYDEPQIVGTCDECDGDLYDDDRDGLCEECALGRNHAR